MFDKGQKQSSTLSCDSSYLINMFTALKGSVLIFISYHFLKTDMNLLHSKGIENIHMQYGYHLPVVFKTLKKYLFKINK